MRCRLCGDRAGWWRRRCAACRRLWDVWQRHRSAGMRELFDAFLATGIPTEKVERFLSAEPARDVGSIRDQIAAEKTNELLAALGQGGTQSGAGAKRLRERGLWRTYDRPPE